MQACFRVENQLVFYLASCVNRISLFDYFNFQVFQNN